MKLEEIEQYASKVNYLPPEKSYEEWTDDECINHTIYMMFNNAILWKTCHIILNMFPLSKTFYKILIKKYIKMYEK